MNGQAVSLIQSDPYLLLAGNLFSNSIVFTVFVLINPVKKYIQMIASDKFLLALTAATILVLCTSFTLHFYARNSNMSNYLIIAAISISYCVFIILMWFNTLRRVVRDEDLKQQKFYNESLRSTLFELRRFRHDWVNNLTVIDSMIKMNKSKELRQYVSELIEHCAGNINTQIYDIKNAGLFGILSSKINLAYSKGISVNISVIGEIEDIPGIKISELCEVVGIFLDNAIEEAEYGDKIININIREGCSYIALSV
jgi:two-component system sensor histidine kinase AgrC